MQNKIFILEEIMVAFNFPWKVKGVLGLIVGVKKPLSFTDIMQQGFATLFITVSMHMAERKYTIWSKLCGYMSY